MARRVFLLTLILRLAFLYGCKSVEDRVTVAVVSGLSGAFLASNCPAATHGGLGRLARQLEILQEQGSFAWIAVGDTFFSFADPPAGLFAQERRKANDIAAVFGRLRPLAIVAGPMDMGVHRQHVASLKKSAQLPIFAPPRTLQARWRADTALHTLGGIKIGFVGVPGDAASEATSLSAAAATMRIQGADLVIAMLPNGGRVGRSLAGQISGVDIAVAGGDGDPQAPRVVNETLVVEAGNRGRFLGLLHLHPRGTDDWVYDDGGESKKAALAQDIAELEAMLADTATQTTEQETTEKKLQRLEHALRSIEAGPPKASHVKWEIVPISHDMEAAAWVSSRQQAYADALCEVGRDATRDLTCKAPPSKAQRYVGDEACRSCHPWAFQVHEQTAHAAAVATLAGKGRACDVSCIPCHTTGFGRPGGICRLADVSGDRNIGCEACHGPGSGHVNAPSGRAAWGPSFTSARSVNACARCHAHERDDLTRDLDRHLDPILGPGHGLLLPSAKPLPMLDTQDREDKAGGVSVKPQRPPKRAKQH